MKSFIKEEDKTEVTNPPVYKHGRFNKRPERNINQNT